MAELQVGDPAPDFEAKDQDNKTVKLGDFKGKKVIVYFYPKDDTGGCTMHACGFRDSYGTIQEKNAVVLGVSPDPADSHVAFRSKYDLPFSLLVDADHKLAEAFGVWRMRPAQERMGIARSHFVIDEDGKLAAVQYEVKPADSSVLALEALSAK
ncbi:MAG: bcp [Chloroflexi bacterium]|nr:bcp [Chloroflexota bacterium]